MTPAEQVAFIKAYANNVASVPSDRVLDFVRRFYAGEDMDYSHDYTSIMDALGMWNDAIYFTQTQGKSE